MNTILRPAILDFLRFYGKPATADNIITGFGGTETPAAIVSECKEMERDGLVTTDNARGSTYSLVN